MRIADALPEVKPLWLEDVIKMDNIDTLADFRRQSRMPISASEMLLIRVDYNEVLLKQAADYVMIDPTWVAASPKRCASPTSPRPTTSPSVCTGCTGPLALFAGLHGGGAVANYCYQETVRAHIQTVYRDLIESKVVIENGHINLPIGPSWSARLNPELFRTDRPGYRITKHPKKLNDSHKKPTPRSRLRGIYGFLPYGTGCRATR